MNGREDKRDNDLFFVCSLIEYIARKTLNPRDAVVNAIGKDGLTHIYELADVYHRVPVIQCFTGDVLYQTAFKK